MLDRITSLLKMGKPGALIPDPGDGEAINVGGRSGSCNLTCAAGSETRTLAAPVFLGQTLSMNYIVDTGTQITVTSAAAINVSNNTTMLFETAGDHIALICGQQGTTLEWRVMANDGVTLG